MKNRRWLPWIVAVIVLLIFGALWVKKIIAEQPTEHPDPGIPEVPDLPDPEDVE